MCCYTRIRHNDVDLISVNFLILSFVRLQRNARVSVLSSFFKLPNKPSERKTRKRSSYLILACVSIICIWVIIHEGRQMVNRAGRQTTTRCSKTQKTKTDCSDGAGLHHISSSSHLTDETKWTNQRPEPTSHHYSFYDIKETKQWQNKCAAAILVKWKSVCCVHVSRWSLLRILTPGCWSKISERREVLTSVRSDGRCVWTKAVTGLNDWLGRNPFFNLHS